VKIWLEVEVRVCCDYPMGDAYDEVAEVIADQLRGFEHDYPLGHNYEVVSVEPFTQGRRNQ
jgi:hypothetical protein